MLSIDTRVEVLPLTQYLNQQDQLEYLGTVTGYSEADTCEDTETPDLDQETRNAAYGSIITQAQRLDGTHLIILSLSENGIIPENKEIPSCNITAFVFRLTDKIH